MNFPYLARLLCQCLASFFFVHLAAGLLLSLATPGAICMAEQMRARSAARLLLALRLLPCALALFAVSAFCLPSYFYLEPEVSSERVGWLCLAAAFLTLAAWTCSGIRAMSAVANSLIYLRQCRRIGRESYLSGERSSVWVLEGSAPFLALVGVIRSRIFISRNVMSTLSREQLAAALRHEDAHRASCDNFKRLVFLLMPDILPLVRAFRPIEAGWARFTEWAADDAAATGNLADSLSLAATLVRVARLCGVVQPAPLLTSLVSNSSDVTVRVDRLLGAAPYCKNPQAWIIPAIASAAVVLIACLIAPMFASGTLYFVHALLERLIH